MSERLLWRVLAATNSTGSARFALALLALRADRAGLVEIAQPDLAAWLGVEVETVRGILRGMRRAGSIELVRRGYYRRPAVYRIPALPTDGEPSETEAA